MKFHLNLILAWLWILLGFAAGMVLGMFFHGDNWLGGYGSFKRRMYRLGHISFFGLGAVNLLFWLTMQEFYPLEPLASVASWAFIVGAITMPVCCVVMAHFPKAHLIFAVPVISLILGGALMMAFLFHQTKNVGSANTPSFALNPQPSRLRQAPARQASEIASKRSEDGSTPNQP